MTNIGCSRLLIPHGLDGHKLRIHAPATSTAANAGRMYASSLRPPMNAHIPALNTRLESEADQEAEH